MVCNIPDGTYNKISDNLTEDIARLSKSMKMPIDILCSHLLIVGVHYTIIDLVEEHNSRVDVIENALE